MMEREIKFRGKTKDGEWVNGYYLPWHAVRDTEGKDVYGQIFEESKEKDKYISKGWIIVIANTVGQYTGLKDKNGVEIYEGDIVKAEYGYGEDGGNFVEFNPFIYAMFEGLVDEDSIEVIGNKWDNPELIGE